jgi:ligand-binding SRPBCC domain-containing protein
MCKRKGHSGVFTIVTNLLERRGTRSSGTVIRDVIEYDIGFGWLGKLAEKLLISRQLQRTFEYRQKALEKLMG